MTVTPLVLGLKSHTLTVASHAYEDKKDRVISMLPIKQLVVNNARGSYDYRCAKTWLSHQNNIPERTVMKRPLTTLLAKARVRDADKVLGTLGIRCTRDACGRVRFELDATSDQQRRARHSDEPH